MSPKFSYPGRWLKAPVLQAMSGIALAVVAFQLTPGDLYPLAPWVAAMVILMAVWWVFEVIPIPVTSLFPLFMLPIFGVTDMSTVCAYYGRPIIFLFLGGFLLALGLQESGIHKRIALHIVRAIGSRPDKLVLGFMIASGSLSMWISNTAAVMVMLPIGLSVLEEAREQGAEPVLLGKFGVCLMLGLAYSADIGGMATVIGTPPNLVFLEMFTQLFPEAPEIGFLEWMAMGLPLSFFFMTGGWLLLTRVIFRLPGDNLFAGREILDHHLAQLGTVGRDERLAGLIFLMAALLWMTGSDLNLGDNFTVYGWRTRMGLQEFSDAGVAVLMATLLFLFPSKDRPGNTLLGWEAARQRVPWGILLLFGGGFAIAGGFELSGLSNIIGDIFQKLTIESTPMLVLIICTVLTFLTEVTSNTAMTNLVLPIIAKASVALSIDPRILMIPATLSASCAFMMPIASPTQAIVFGSGHVSIRQMMRAGIWFNVLGIILVSLIFMLFGHLILGIDMNAFPEWANPIPHKPASGVR